MKKFNCTTPFGDKKTSICEDPKTAIKALNLYLGYQFANNGKYLDACNYVKLKISSQREFAWTNHSQTFSAELQFESKVKKVKTFELYGFESLIAEIGGWVGLFLGVSIFQLTSLIDHVYDGLKCLKLKMQNSKA